MPQMASWTPYRSREIVYAKPRTGPNGEEQIRLKDGQVMPAEVFRRRYEPLEDQPGNGQTTSGPG